LVVSRITEFYTYMKAARDLQRKIAEISPPQGDASRKGRRDMGHMDLWHGTMADLIYMVFLGCESGRKAVKDLIEFQPTRAERTIVILLTELECYGFLLEEFRDDTLRRPRLMMRRQLYINEMQELYERMKKHYEYENDWKPAKLIFGNLTILYNRLFPEHRIADLDAPAC
jgi:hypothetical protein